jgi:hypothetical protein
MSNKLHMEGRVCGATLPVPPYIITVNALGDPCPSIAVTGNFEIRLETVEKLRGMKCISHRKITGAR